MSPIIPVVLQLILRKLKKRALKSATIGVAGGVGAAGIAAAIKPEMLELIPEQYRGYAILAVGVLITVARLRKELAEALQGIEKDSDE